METHYFQRYHSKENVDTANAMLLLSRLYLNSPKSFFSFLNNLVEDIDIDVELKVVCKKKIRVVYLMLQLCRKVLKLPLKQNCIITLLKNNYCII